uniref:Stearoyl-CoA desaturase b n=1 Tax=Astatotilapia calliptera TaxID=8154 RepID=A0A3P8PQ29_ASTCA
STPTPALQRLHSLTGSTVDDAIYFTYKEKPWKLPTVLRWRNIIVFILLHLGALYGLILISSTSPSTLAWSEYSGNPGACLVVRLHMGKMEADPLYLRCDILHAFSLSMCMQKNIYEWVRDHCLHHKYVCTDADPHNASRGFFFSHIGWLLVQEHPDCAEKKQKLSLSDLTTDKVVMFQKRHYVVSMLVLWFLVPTLVPWYFWGESLVVGCFVPGLLRHVAVLNATWLVNSVAQMWGNRPYDKNINPRENKFVSFSLNIQMCVIIFLFIYFSRFLNGKTSVLSIKLSFTCFNQCLSPYCFSVMSYHHHHQISSLSLFKNDLLH